MNIIWTIFVLCDDVMRTTEFCTGFWTQHKEGLLHVINLKKRISSMMYFCGLIVSFWNIICMKINATLLGRS